MLSKGVKTVPTTWKGYRKNEKRSYSAKGAIVTRKGQNVQTRYMTLITIASLFFLDMKVVRKTDWKTTLTTVAPVWPLTFHVQTKSPGSFFSVLFSVSSSVSSWAFLWSDWTLSLRTRLWDTHKNNIQYMINTHGQNHRIKILKYVYLIISVMFLHNMKKVYFGNAPWVCTHCIWILLWYSPESRRKVIWW